MAKTPTKKSTAGSKKKAPAKKAPAKKTSRVCITPRTLVRKALRGIAGRIESDDMKASVGDLIRLLQLRQEIESGEAKEIKVTWVEPGEKPASGK